MTIIPLVSVIVPCYNSGDTLFRTIDSVLKQTWKNIELIIVNDGSTDRSTVELLDSFSHKPNITVHSQINKGLASARNSGIRLSKGDYILPLDSDDWLDADAIKIMLETCKQGDSSSIVFSDIKLEGARKGIKKTHCNPFEQLFSNQLPYSLLLPIEVINKINGYDEDLINGLEDWDLNIRLLLNKKNFLKTDKPIFHYWVNTKGMFQAVTSKKFGYIFGHIREKYSETYKITNLLKTMKYSRKISSNRMLLVYLIQNFIYSIFPKKLYNFVYYFLIKINQRFRLQLRFELNGK
jgi:glycosyltransferase involved in cell wall biosynthesis